MVEKILNNTTPYGKIRALHEGSLHSSTLKRFVPKKDSYCMPHGSVEFALCMTAQEDGFNSTVVSSPEYLNHF